MQVSSYNKCKTCIMAALREISEYSYWSKAQEVNATIGPKPHVLCPTKHTKAYEMKVYRDINGYFTRTFPDAVVNHIRVNINGHLYQYNFGNPLPPWCPNICKHENKTSYTGGGLYCTDCKEILT